MRLQTRFLLIYGLGSIVFLSLTTTIVFLNMQSSMTSKLEEQFLVDSEYKYKILLNLINNLSSNFTSYTNVPIFRSLRYHQLTLNKPEMLDDLRQLELYFLEQQKNNPQIEKVQLINSQGRELLHLENQMIHRSLKDLTLEQNIQQVLLHAKNKIRVTTYPDNGSPEKIIWWVPVNVANNVHLGVLSIHLNFSYIRNLISDLGEKNSEWACLYNENKQLLSTSHQSQQCDNHGFDVWISEHRLQLHGIDWLLSLQANKASFLEDIMKLRWYVYGLVLPLIALISFIVIFITSKQITSSINKIVYSARLLGSNKPYRPVNIWQADELNQLSTELNRTASLIQARTNELVQSNEELESYSYTIAHDLRTPLRTIAGFSDLLQIKAKDKLDTDEIESLNRIIQASHKMSDLIDNTLELSRITRADIRIEQVNLSVLAEHILNDLRIANPENSIEWHIAQGMTVNGDRDLLKILLENLLSNAWKYSRNVEKACIHFYSTLQNDTYVFCIQDNGAGFDMKYADKLFKPFERLHSLAEFEGSGIGMASAQRIVTKHHGRIWAESEPNKGTTIYFSLGDIPLSHKE